MLEAFNDIDVRMLTDMINTVVEEDTAHVTS